MFKIKTSAPWIASLLLVVCSGILYKLSFLHHRLIPNEERFPWDIVKSEDKIGSEISVETAETVQVKVRLSGSGQYPFANLNFIVGDQQGSRAVDWSGYTKLLLKIRCEPANVLAFSIGSIDSGVSHKEDPVSYRPSEFSFSCDKDWATIPIDLTRLNTPDWWLRQYNLHVSDKQYALDKITSFSILHSAQTPIDTDFSYQIAAATLEGRNSYIQFGAWICLALALGLLLTAVHKARLKKLIQQKIELTKQESHSFVYQPVPIVNRKDKLKNSLLEFLATEYTNPELSLESAISALGMNRSKVNEILKEEYGLTFSAYLTKLRLTEAARLLTKQDQSVAEIGYAVGYKTASYFNRAFKKEYGCTPNAFRHYSSEDAS